MSQLDLIPKFQPFFSAYLRHGGLVGHTWQYIVWIRARWVEFRRVDHGARVGEIERFGAWLEALG